MAKKTTITVVGRVERILTDRTRYKNYQPEIAFDALYVTFQVPEKEAVLRDDGSVVVTLDGFANHILDPFAASLEEMHTRWEEEKAKKDEKKQREQMQKPQTRS